MESSMRCGKHADRAAVASCARCGRAVCIECAVPFRGDVLCTEDAARELGSPLPESPHVQRSRRPDVVAGTLLALALLATVPPWHGEGELTSLLSAWRPGLEPWALIACASILVAAAFAVAPLFLSDGPRTLLAVGYASLAVLAAGATTITLVAAPDFFSPTPAPFITIVLALTASGVGFARLRALRV